MEEVVPRGKPKLALALHRARLAQGRRCLAAHVHLVGVPRLSPWPSLSDLAVLMGPTPVVRLDSGSATSSLGTVDLPKGSTGGRIHSPLSRVVYLGSPVVPGMKWLGTASLTFLGVTHGAGGAGLKTSH